MSHMGVFFSLIIAVFACDLPSPERQLAEANGRLDAARAEARAIEVRVEERRQAVRRAEQALAKARTQLDEAETELALAREKIPTGAADVALFRTVQTALLHREGLEDFAIRVEIAGDDAVTLRGEVDEESQAELAIDTARSLPGVEQVSSEIRVRGTGDAGG